MKPVVVDADIFIDLMRIQMIRWLFIIGFDVYTTQEIINQLNDKQTLLLMEFIESKQLTVYRLSEKELEEVVNLTPARNLELSDKSVVWLSIHLNAVVLSSGGLLRRFWESNNLEVMDMVWFFNLLIEKQLLRHPISTQEMERLLLPNLLIHLRQGNSMV